MAKDREEFYQFFTLVQEKGGHVLRDLIQYLYKKNGILSFENFLNRYKHELFHKLWQPNNSCCPAGGGQSCYKSEPNKKSIFTNTQWKQLYQRSSHSLTHRNIGPCPCEWEARTTKDLIDELDFTLLSHIVKTIYDKQLTQSQLTSVDLIRDERNKLAHPKILKVDCFTTRWEQVKNSLLDLANLCLQPDQQKNLEQDINRLKTRHVTKEDIENLERKIITPEDLELSEKRTSETVRKVVQKEISNLQNYIDEKFKFTHAELAENCAVGAKRISAHADSAENCAVDAKRKPAHAESAENCAVGAKRIYPPADSAENCAVRVSIKSMIQLQFEDIRKTQKLIENVSESMKNLSEDIKVTLNSFIEEIRELQKCFDEYIPFEKSSEDDLDECFQEYKHIVGTRGKMSLQECWKELEEKYLIVYNKDEYEALSETDWKEIEAIRYPIYIVEQKNKRQKNEIDEKLKKAVIEEHVCRTEECRKEMRIVIVGKTGVGKSALGNLLLQIPNYFVESAGSNSETAKVKEGSRMIGNRKLRVLDTPGLFDTKRSLEEVKKELAKCVLKFKDGFHAMAVVLNGSNLKYTPEEQRAVAEIKNIFGSSIMNFCFVVITHMGGITEDVTAQQFVEEIEQEEFKILVHEDFGKRLMFVDNTASSLYEQKGFISAFIGMVDSIHKLQKKVYTDGMFIEAKRISDFEEKKENERKEKQILDELNKYDSIRNAIEKKVCQKLSEKARKKVMSMSDDGDSKMKRKVIDSVSAVLNKEQLEFIRKYPDTNLISNICNEIFEKEKNRKIGLASNSDTETVSVDDISLSVAEKKVIEGLFRELHGAVGEVVGIYLKNKEESAEMEVSSDEMKPLTEKVINKLSEEAKTYFPKETIDNEIEYKVKKENYTFTKVGQTTESKLKSPEGGQGASPVCFPADAVVYTSRGSICMSDIMIGDRVLTFDSNTNTPIYEDVIMLSHAEFESITEMMKIATSDSQIILSPGHLIHLNSYGNLVPARLVTKGDNLCSYINNSFVWSEVLSVCTVKKQGLYCPHTIGGSVIVSGVLASCGTEHVSQSVTKASMYVIKTLYCYLPSSVYQILYGRNRTQDVPYLLYKLKPIYFKF